ncbi:MAG: DNA methylase [Clostridia bacterium]|nr:DNA methylase [Clostridia bacterium]
MQKTYIAIDLKSFYASVECVERGLDPLTTNLVVADKSRTEKTICLAVSPSLKTYGTGGRPRLFEVVQRVSEVNKNRKQLAPNHSFTGSSYDDTRLRCDPSLALDYIVAVPRMAFYMKYSTNIHKIYLEYFSSEDIHVYSIDEVFIDVTGSLDTYKMTAHELTMTVIRKILERTGITATAGIGTNMYLAKVAMDIVAKHIEPDKDGVRIAELDEMIYRRLLWEHTPITDFWRVGSGYAKRLAEKGMYTMGDIAMCSLGSKTDLYNEELLFKMFGVNAELLIDHAWGYEPCTIADIKAYKPQSSSLGSGQVLHCPYDFDKARLIVKEMADTLALELVEKRLVTDQIVLTINYDKESLNGSYKGEVTTDRYGRSVPKHAHGAESLDEYTSSTKGIVAAAMKLYDRIVKKSLLVRRINITANHVINEDAVPKKPEYEQLSLFDDYEKSEAERNKAEEKKHRERSMQRAIVAIKQKYGKNSVVKGMNLSEGATSMDRNAQIGGHKA